MKIWGPLGWLLRQYCYLLSTTLYTIYTRNKSYWLLGVNQSYYFRILLGENIFLVEIILNSSSPLDLIISN